MASFSTFFHGRLSGLEITCLQSFLDHGHSVKIYCYEDCEAPSHFELADAASLVPREEIFYYQSGPGQGSIAGFSNLFRYAVLRSEGGWWTDTDVACLSSRWPESQSPVVAAWQDRQEHHQAVNSAVLHLSTALATDLESVARNYGDKPSWGQTGPALLTGLVREKNLQHHILDHRAFYPVHHSRWIAPFMRQYTSRIVQVCAASFAVHLWNELLRRARFDKRMLPDPSSFFGSLVTRHGTEKYFQPSVPDLAHPRRHVAAPTKSRPA